MPPILDYLERVAPPTGGFWSEDRLTLADIAIASPLRQPPYMGCVRDTQRHPRVCAYVQLDPRAAELRSVDRARDCIPGEACGLTKKRRAPGEEERGANICCGLRSELPEPPVEPSLPSSSSLSDDPRPCRAKSVPSVALADEELLSVAGQAAGAALLDELIVRASGLRADEAFAGALALAGAQPRALTAAADVGAAACVRSFPIRCCCRCRRSAGRCRRCALDVRALAAAALAAEAAFGALAAHRLLRAKLSPACWPAVAG